MRTKMNIALYVIMTGLLTLALASCSTQKNTRVTRSFHQTKVRYNILYNGNIAYEEGLKAIRDANSDDYTTILNLYPVSNHKAAESAASQMDKTIDKCRIEKYLGKMPREQMTKVEDAIRESLGMEIPECVEAP